MACGGSSLPALTLGIILLDFAVQAVHVTSQSLIFAQRPLEAHGAVSEPVVIEMAIGALRAARADYAISISGVAGPDGGSDVKPVGTVWFGFATAQGEGITRRECFSGDRESVRRQATVYALKTLWQQFLQNT
jgi:nicotinamide-nucleotide amidase